MLNKNPFQITEFKGLNYGSVDPHFLTRHTDQINFSNAVEGTNLTFTKEGGIRTRPGVKIRANLDLTLDGSGSMVLDVIPMQHWRINRLLTTDYTNRWLVLEWDETAGTLYDLDGDTSTAIPILTLNGMKYASIINIFGRLYISPLSDFGVPLAAESIYLYDGTGTPDPYTRKAGGTKPTAGALTVSEETNAVAFVTAGLHLCAIAYETDSGFITRPNDTWLQVTITADSGKSIKFDDIDIGPDGTVARHLLVTKTIQNYDNVQENWELFFGLRIPDNTTTTGEILLPDTGLVESADYLLDIYEELPSCSTISVLAGRLMYNGIRTDKRVILVSQVADPETISQLEDYIQIYDSIPADITTGKELRGQYYMFKESSTYVTNDNGGAPNTWKIELIDSGMGAAPFGIAEVMANPGGLVLDNLLIANLSGIYAFAGTFIPVPLGRNLHAVFTQDIPRDESKYTRLSIDPVNRICYLLVGKPIEKIPDDPTNITGGCFLYIGDYYNGIDVESIKWMGWDPRITMAMSPLNPAVSGFLYLNDDATETTVSITQGGHPIISGTGTYVGILNPPPAEWDPGDGDCHAWSYDIPDIGVLQGTFDLEGNATGSVGFTPDSKTETLVHGPNTVNFIVLTGG